MATIATAATLETVLCSTDEEANGEVVVLKKQKKIKSLSQKYRRSKGRSTNQPSKKRKVAREETEQEEEKEVGAPRARGLGGGGARLVLDQQGAENEQERREQPAAGDG